MKRIISLDPGIGRTGYAVLEKEDQTTRALDYGCIETQVNGELQSRLLKIYEDLTKIIKKFDPEIMVVERLFFSNNQKTAITVGQAQGVMLLVAAQFQMPLSFVTPLQIKSALTGYGQASKDQVSRMVKILLSLEKMPKLDDTTDALACGLTYLALYKLQAVQ